MASQQGARTTGVSRGTAGGGGSAGGSGSAGAGDAARGTPEFSIGRAGSRSVAAPAARRPSAASRAGVRDPFAEGGRVMGRAAAARGAPRWGARVGRLWQLPMLLVSVAAFAVAAWLFIDPKPGLTIDQKIEIGRGFLRQERAEAAIGHLNLLLAKERLEKDREAEIRLLVAEGLALGQKQKKVSIPENHRRIVEQTLTALELGAKPTGPVNQRLAESFEALGRPTEALMYYRRAMLVAPDKGLMLQRKVIELQLAVDDLAGAASSLEEYLSKKELKDPERAWAMGEMAHVQIDRGEYAAARRGLEEALHLTADAVDQGQLTYWLGYCEYRLGQKEQAERYLRLAREQLRVQHPLDAEAAALLGKVAQDGGRAEEAISFYEAVLTSHPDSRAAVVARLGRGVCRVLAGQDDAGLTDLHDVTSYVNQREGVKRKYRVEALMGLKTAAQALSERGNFQGALEVLAYEQALATDAVAPGQAVPPPGAPGGPPATFYARLAGVYEKRAEQIERNIADSVKAAEKIRREQQVRDYRAKAGDGYIAYSRALTLADDKGYAEALWKGIELYDHAGDLQRMITALELFAAERPEDPLAPEALLRLGRAYQAGGMFDKAIGAYQRNQFRYPNTLAASKSAVPLAQAFVAKGPEFYAKAEQVLNGVVDNNPLITPEAAEFRQALFELAQLFYRTGRYEEAVAKLEELTNRYPKDERLGQLVFLMGDSYRKSAALLQAGGEKAKTGKGAAGGPGAAAAGAPAGGALPAAGSAAGGAAGAKVAGAGGGGVAAGEPDPVEAAAARRERLGKARLLFDRAIELYRRSPPAGDLDKLYLKLAHFYRADCVFDLGGYDEAIKLYDAAAFRYQDDPSALAAYVQIVNAYCALGKIAEAKTANERAKWLLKKMPPEAFAEGGFTMPKEYWDKWLQWTGAAGMW